MKVGFTGTQQGMTPAQRMAFSVFLDSIKVDEFHHGDCVGADANAHEIVMETYGRGLIAIHPPSNISKRAFCKGEVSWVPKTYLDRNRDIVDVSDILVATPKETTNQVRSGTWYTVRYAVRCKKYVVVIYPDGRVDGI